MRFLPDADAKAGAPNDPNGLGLDLVTHPGQRFEPGEKHAEHEGGHEHDADDPPQSPQPIQVTRSTPPKRERHLKPSWPGWTKHSEPRLLLHHPPALERALMQPAVTR